MPAPRRRRYWVLTSPRRTSAAPRRAGDGSRVCNVLRRARDHRCVRRYIARGVSVLAMSCLGATRGARGFRTSDCCGIGVLRTLVMPFLLSVWLSRSWLSSEMPQVRGKMIKKTAGPLQSQDKSGGGPGSNEDGRPPCSLDPASGCKALASPALLPKRSPRRARAQGAIAN